MEHKVEYEIKSNAVPIIILDGKKLGVISCSYQWCTRAGNNRGTTVMMASCADKQYNKYDVVINPVSGEVFVQAYKVKLGAE